MYEMIGEYSNALEFHKKTLEIEQKCAPLNRVGLAETYHNMARVFECLKQYEEAPKHTEHANEIVCQSSFPSNQLDSDVSTDSR